MIKVGIIGIGIRGTMFADTLLQNRYAEVTAVTDSSRENLQKASERYGVNGYTGSEEMMEKEDLDAVIIATPDFTHCAPVLQAAAKGISILVEKPFATNVEEAEKMFDAVERAGVICMVAFENRWNPPFVAVHNAVADGEIGGILAMNSRLNDTIYVPTRMLRWSGNSTPGWFLLPHSIDIALWLKGCRPLKVYATGTKKKLVSMGIDTYDSIQTLVSFEDQTHASFTTSWVLPESMPLIYDFKYEIIGESGAFYIDLADQMVRQAGAGYRHIHTLGTPINGKFTSAPSCMAHEFIDHVRKGTCPEADAAMGLLNTRTVEAVHRSLESGKTESIEGI